jgi:hypothetical protein
MSQVRKLKEENTNYIEEILPHRHKLIELYRAVV